LKSERIAYNASSRNFIFANLAKKSFSTATRYFDNRTRPLPEESHDGDGLWNGESEEAFSAGRG